MENAFLAYLIGVSSLADLVGDRIGWGWRRQGDAVPAVTLFNVDGARGVVMEGYDGFVDGHVQLDIWSNTMESGLAVRDALIAAFPVCKEDTTGGVVQGVFVTQELSGFEGEKPDRLFRTRLMLRLPHAET